MNNSERLWHSIANTLWLERVTEDAYSFPTLVLKVGRSPAEEGVVMRYGLQPALRFRLRKTRLS